MPAIKKAALQHSLGRGLVIVIAFQDGHWGMFYPNYDASHQATSLEQFRIISPSREIAADFCSPFQARNTAQPEPKFGFRPLVKPYTLEETLPYLMSAWTHLRDTRPVDPSTGQDMWLLVRDSDDLVTAIQARTYPVPPQG